MANVEFEEPGNEYQPRQNFVSREVSGIAHVLIKWGIAKDEAQAKIVMVVVMLICFGITAFVVFLSGPKVQKIPFQPDMMPLR